MMRRRMSNVRYARAWPGQVCFCAHLYVYVCTMAVAVVVVAVVCSNSITHVARVVHGRAACVPQHPFAPAGRNEGFQLARQRVEHLRVG